MEQDSSSPVRVLVSDDSETIRRTAQLSLIEAGCTVLLAEDGFDALAQIVDHQPHVVFVDMMRPRLDGRPAHSSSAIPNSRPRRSSCCRVRTARSIALADACRDPISTSPPFNPEALLKAVFETCPQAYSSQ